MKIEPILADAGISISQLKKNPSAVIAASDGFAVAILNRNKPAAYLVPALLWEEILDRLDDIELVRIARERWDQPSIAVDIDDLANL
jgi:antitoxin StbD